MPPCTDATADYEPKCAPIFEAAVGLCRASLFYGLSRKREITLCAYWQCYRLVIRPLLQNFHFVRIIFMNHCEKIIENAFCDNAPVRMFIMLNQITL